ncbi:MAG TPA: ketoacyl-ACP synthase III [Candidatus Sulfomarinibacteraceae bacterium]|nr:ketoacyl-ACP synthase III [Candidatus Sulfomarinibacteraceae bacterium]
MTPRYAQILSTGRYVPQKVLTNAYFDELFPERDIDGWLRKNVGIEQRHVMAEDETTSDMSRRAAEQALQRAGVTAQDLDLIIVATDTPDYISPATATVLQAKLGAQSAGTFDINTACAGWVTAMDTAARYVMTDPALQYALVVGAYGMSRFVDYSDHKTCTLFADGAAATVIGAGDEPGFLAGKLVAAGEYYDALGIYTGGVAQPRTPSEVNEGVPRVQFVRKFPATFNSDQWPPLVREVAQKAGLAVDDVDFFLFTQLNVNTIKETMRLLAQPLEKTHWIMDKWGYTGSACIPMALDDALERGRGPQPGDNVLFVASGGGISMAAGLWRWTANR